MAEILATFAALSSVLQVLDFTVKFAKHAHELINSEQHTSKQNAHTEDLARECRALASLSLDEPSAGLEAISRLRNECRVESERLLRLLESFKVTSGSKSVRNIIHGGRAALRAFSRRQDVERQRDQLKALNGLLGTAILQHLVSKHEVAVEHALIGSYDLQSQPGGKQISDDAKVIHLAKQQRKIVRNMDDHILSCLAFKDMNRRGASIQHAYPDTYHWALDDERIGLKKWLQAEDGIFWVCGKAGSGKSTLMRYLTTSSTLTQLLLEWCGAKELVFAHFYFWYLGSPLEKSTKGLLQSILHQILSERRELLTVAFPHCYETIRWPLGLPNLSDEELHNAIKAIANHEPHTDREKRFCFFIDGLDEYDGSHIQLVCLLKDLCQNPDIKICASSRPWNVFHKCLADGPTLKLEDLTEPDIRYYVQDSIQRARESLPRSTEDLDLEVCDLVQDIVRKAEGVFLWVLLVTRSVLNGLGEGDDICTLRARVELLPSDLNLFFRNILDRVDNVYQKQTAQALRLAYITVQRRSTSGKHFLNYWFIKNDHDGLADPDLGFESHLLQMIDKEEFAKITSETRTFLSAICKDLLCLSAKPSAVNVDFLHRTVWEFLSARDIQERLNVQAHFPSPDVFYLLALRRLQYILPGDLDDQCGPCREDIHELVCSENPVSTPPFLTQLDQLLTSRHQMSYKIGLKPYRNSDDLKWLASLISKGYHQCALEWYLQLNQERRSLGKTFTSIRSRRLAAACVGEDPRHTFSPHLTNVTLFKAILETDLAIEEKLRGNEYDAYSASFLYLLLRSWAMSELLALKSGGQANAEMEPLRTVWNLAKLLLSAHHGSNLVSRYFLVSKPSRDVTDIAHSAPPWSSVAHFLKSRVPAAWLRELPQTEYLVNCSAIEDSGEQSGEPSLNDLMATNFYAVQ